MHKETNNYKKHGNKENKKTTCCKKYVKKGHHCKGCTEAAHCDLPEK